MSQIYKNNNGGGGGGSVLQLTPDSGAPVTPTAGNINVSGVSTNDTNFETFNGGTSILLIEHRYQGTATTSDGAGQTQTILTIPLTVASVCTCLALITGIEATGPNGVGGQVTGVVFRGAGGASLLTTSDVIQGASAALPNATFAITASGNNLIVTVTGQATFTIEWQCIATISFKSFI